MTQPAINAAFASSYLLKVYNRDLGSRPFELAEEIRFTTAAGIEIVVPVGYATDFASVPRFFHRVVSPIGRHGKAAIVHDWLCDEAPHTTDHRTAADIFDQAMRVLGVPAWRRKIMVLAVKFGGPKFQKSTR